MTTTFLVQSTAQTVVAYLETPGGSAAEDLTASDVQVALKKTSDTYFVPKTLTNSASASASIGSGADGTVDVSVAGTAGNSYTIEVVVPAGTSDLSVTVVGTVITVNLAVSSGTPIAAENTAALIAAAIDAAGTQVEADYSGDGSDPISAAEGPTPLVGGSDGNFTHLGDGFYEIDLTAADTLVLGNLHIRITGGGLKTSLLVAYVAASNPDVPPTSPSIATSILFGFLKKADGSALVGASVYARPLSSPTVLHSGTEGMGVGTDAVTTRSDASGYFTLSLAAGMAVDFSIPSINFRRTLTVPGSTTNVFDIA
jgi:hypothetical protein